jgi:CheY-like chemotaxis protein
MAAANSGAGASQADAFVGEALRWLPDADDTPMIYPAPVLAGKRPAVVLADDNADMRQYLSRLLAASYEVTAVADGKDALAAAARVHPDVILTDVMMPGLDGFALLEQLKADPELRDIPVIMLSARAGEEAKVESLGMGAHDYLVKPSARAICWRECLPSSVGLELAMRRTRRHSGSWKAGIACSWRR